MLVESDGVRKCLYIVETAIKSLFLGQIKTYVGLYSMFACYMAHY
jgi:hypothetical protein